MNKYFSSPSRSFHLTFLQGGGVLSNSIQSNNLSFFEELVSTEDNLDIIDNRLFVKLPVSVLNSLLFYQKEGFINCQRIISKNLESGDFNLDLFQDKKYSLKQILSIDKFSNIVFSSKNNSRSSFEHIKSGIYLGTYYLIKFYRYSRTNNLSVESKKISFAFSEGSIFIIDNVFQHLDINPSFNSSLNFSSCESVLNNFFNTDNVIFIDNFSDALNFSNLFISSAFLVNADSGLEQFKKSLN